MSVRDFSDVEQDLVEDAGFVVVSSGAGGATAAWKLARAAGSNAMGVCTPDLRPRDTRNLWVVDSSVFPTNLGVNPQHTIQAVALAATEEVSSAS